MAGKPNSTKAVEPKASKVLLTFDGSGYMHEPDTGTTLAHGESAEFPTEVAERLLADSTVRVHRGE